MRLHLLSLFLQDMAVYHTCLQACGHHADGQTGCSFTSCSLTIPKNTAGLRHKKRRKQGSKQHALKNIEIYTMQVPGLLTIPHHHILDQAYSTFHTLKYGAVIYKHVEPHTQLSWETCFHGLQVGHTCTRLYLILYYIIIKKSTDIH